MAVGTYLRYKNLNVKVLLEATLDPTHAHPVNVVQTHSVRGSASRPYTSEPTHAAGTPRSTRR